MIGRGSPFRPGEAIWSIRIGGRFKTSGMGTKGGIMGTGNGNGGIRDRMFQEFRDLDLLDRAGRIAVPYLIDPNTGKELFESEAILDYLDQTYGR